MMYMSYRTLASSEMLKQLTGEIIFPFLQQQEEDQEKELCSYLKSYGVCRYGVLGCSSSSSSTSTLSIKKILLQTFCPMMKTIL